MYSEILLTRRSQACPIRRESIPVRESTSAKAGREAGVKHSLRRIQYCPRKACDNAFVFLIEPPILEDLEPPYNTAFQERVANQRIAFPCPAKGVYDLVTWALA